MQTLAHKYVPATSHDVLVSPVGTVDQLRGWVNDCAAGSASWVTAPVGVGLSTLVSLLAKEAHVQLVVLSMHQPHLGPSLEAAGSTLVGPDGRKKIIVVDHLDGVPAAAPTMVELTTYLRACVHAAPTLCIGHPAKSAKFEAVMSKRSNRVARFVLNRPSPDVIVERVRAICESEGLDDSGIPELCAASKYDLANILAALQYNGRDASKDNLARGLDAVERVLTGSVHSVRAATDLYGCDPSVLPVGIHENFLPACAHLDQACHIAEAFSVTDVMDSAMYARQEWQLGDEYAALVVGTPAIEFSGSAPVKRRAPSEKFGVLWSKTYDHASKRRGLRRVMTCRATAGLVELPAEDMAFLRGFVRHAVGTSEWAAARAACEGLDSAAVLSLMRLSKCDYKLSAHARLRKALDL